MSAPTPAPKPHPKKSSVLAPPGTQAQTEVEALRAMQDQPVASRSATSKPPPAPPSPKP